MNAYCQFMDRQTLSEAAHARLLALEVPAKHKSPWMAYGSLAAALLVAVGLGIYGLWGGGPAPKPQPPVAAALPTASDTPSPDDASGHSFVAQGPESGGKLMFPNVHGVDYADVSQDPELAASIALPDGSFEVELTREETLRLFWGPEGKPQAVNPKVDTGDFPLFLMEWQGYTIRATALYDGKGDLWQLTVYGELGEDSFTLRAAPGRIPPTCVVEGGAVTTQVLDTEVKGWYRSYDLDGDGEIEYACASEFLANGVGYRFENIGAGGMRAGGDEATVLGGAQLFNAMAVNQFCRVDGGLYLDDIAHTDDIPAWREKRFETLAEARGEEKFAPYLPAEGPGGFGEFEGSLHYQEGVRNWLSVRWSRGYDDVEVTVWLPEDPAGYPQDRPTVDVNVPESYDWRLYDGPICDVVPEEYQMEFYMPTFRAQDMSLSVVQAREHEKDTGGQAYRFRVCHENGVVVDYGCSGVSAEYVWSLVEATL